MLRCSDGRLAGLSVASAASMCRPFAQPLGPAVWFNS